MLTGGIDMSVGVVATMAGFVMATQTPIHGPPGGHPHRVGRFRARAVR